ncbi:MAG: hypothetical protein LBV71_16995 [Prevotella sp.]|jgi:hypothetical protein|nr:hypothetical protein [Prevotella sp.]
MKTSILKLVCGVFSIAFLFSSCLGDSDNKIEIGSDLAFITTMGSSYSKVAAVTGKGYGNMYIQSPQIDQLQEGQCYLLSYRITNLSANSSGYYTAEDFGAVPVKLNQTLGAATAPVVENNFAPTSFSLAYYSPSYFQSSSTTYVPLFGDRWVFNATTLLKEKDEVYMYFYYDKSKQQEEVNGVMTDIGDNKIIIDVRFKKESFGDGVESNKQIMAVGNLSDIKRDFRRSDKFSFASGEKTRLVPIKFRYMKSVTEGNNTVNKETLDGTWNTDQVQFAFLYSTEIE